MALVIVTFIASLIISLASAGNFYNDVSITFGNERAQILNGGQDLTLSLDNYSGSGFESQRELLFGRFDAQIKLVPGNSAGTVTTFYLSSQGDKHDEIDFEFLGNASGQPYTIHTNYFAQGVGGREQRFFLWFDPTASFHNYSIVWNSQRIIWLIDNIPIRVSHNSETMGTPFPKNQAMRVYASLWEADDWATQGGRVKTDWAKAPFTASYRNINIDASCIASSSSSCGSTNVLNAQAWQTQDLDSDGRNRLGWVKSNYMIYNYCTDTERFPQGPPPECAIA